MRHDPIGDLGIAALDALVATWSEPGPEDPGALAPRDLRQQYDAQKLAHDRRRGQALTDLRMVAMTAIPGLLARLRMAEAVRDRVGAVLVAAGCSCDCGHDSEGHDDDCDRCVACLVQGAING